MTRIDRATTKPIISVKEARKLLGKEISDELTDERVAEVVALLHSIAEYYIQDAICKDKFRTMQKVTNDKKAS